MRSYIERGKTDRQTDRDSKTDIVRSYIERDRKTETERKRDRDIVRCLILRVTDRWI